MTTELLVHSAMHCPSMDVALSMSNFHQTQLHVLSLPHTHHTHLYHTAPPGDILPGTYISTDANCISRLSPAPNHRL